MSRFVDFKAVNPAVSMLQVLEHYGLAESFKSSGIASAGLARFMAEKTVSNFAKISHNPIGRG